MPIFSCPSCGVKLQIPGENLESRVRCPRCQNIFQPAQARPAEPPGPMPPPPLPQGPPASQHVMARQGNHSWPASPGEKIPSGSSRPRSRRDDEDEENEYENGEGRYRPRLLLRRLSGIGLARAAVILILATVGIELINLIIDFIYLHQLKDLDAPPGFPDMGDIEIVEMIRGLLGILQLAVFIATVVVFSMWIYRAATNLRWLGVRGRQYSPGWAVGYFFVPILNLFRPLQVVQEIWRASHPRVPAGDVSWQEKPGSALAGLWWAFWIISNIAGNISFRLAWTDPASLEILKTGVIVDMVSAATLIPAGILITLIINGIMKRQAEKLENLRSDEVDFDDYEPEV